ncbi:MAG: endonuclease/exonuclease/phosphatase family protein, partial [Limisphaerales bacterium]
VLTYNIHHGEGTDQKLDLERIARIIRAQNPDLVAVQEVDEKTERVGGLAEATELGRLTGMRHVFGKAMDYRGGGYGQAILSRWPIKEHEVHQLPQRTNREPRILLTATIAAPGGDIMFATTHLDHQIETIRLEQATAINKILIAENHAPWMILGGDFNAEPESGTMKTLLEHWTDTAGNNSGPTIPAREPNKRIDYLLAHAKHGSIKLLRSEVLNEPIASDHRPVVATIEISR